MMPERLRDQKFDASKPLSESAPSPPRLAASPGSWLVGLLLALGVGTAASVNAQYIPDTGRVETADIPTKESLEKAYGDARWRLGALALEPFLGLRDASLATNQDPRTGEDEETDLTVTVGAGLRAYARTSPKIMVAGHALPEYVWWQDDDDRSQLAGRYGLGVFGHLNRLHFELSYRLAEQQAYFSSELPILATVERDTAKAAVEVEVSRGIKVYVAARDIEVSSSTEEIEIFSILDRSEERLATGVRLESRRGLWADLAYEESTTDFGAAARNLSNDGTTLGVGFGFEKNRLTGALNLAFREMEPLPESQFRPFDDVTGEVQLLFQPRASLGFLTFFERGHNYSISADQSYFVSDRYGLTVRFGLGRTASLQLRAAFGEDVYEGLTVAPERIDDVEDLRLQLDFPIRDLLVISLHGGQVDYDSNYDAFDRDFTVYGLNVRLGRLAEKLRLGDPSGAW